MWLRGKAGGMRLKVYAYINITNEHHRRLKTFLLYEMYSHNIARAFALLYLRLKKLLHLKLSRSPNRIFYGASGSRWRFRF